MRGIKIGEFDGNTAKSCAYEGMIFTHHEAGGDLKNLRLIKNRWRGLYLYASRNVTLKSTSFQENMLDNFLARWSDNIEVDDVVVVGVTKSTKTLTKPPYFNKPCKSHNFHPPVGLKLPVAIHRRDSSQNLNNVGARISNTHFFNFDHDDECEASIPINFNSEDDHGRNHFDYLTTFLNVTVNGTNLIDAESSNEDGINDIIIHDIDGSSSPTGNSSEPGMFVRDVLWLSAFSEGVCTQHPRRINYCTNSCYRTVTFFVDQTSSETIDVRVTRTSDEVEVLVPYNEYSHEDDVHRKHYWENLRGFSLSLPEGEYTIEFLEDLQIVWPKFALQRWDGRPDCDGHVSVENVIVIEPQDASSSCDNMIINGDMEQGIYYWQHRNGGSNKQYGELLAAPGEGIDGSTAVRYYNRSQGYSGIGQHLDTRCIHRSLNQFYEIEMYFRLENGTVPFVCDPFSSDWMVRCPFVTFQQQKVVNETLKSAYIHHRANVIVPNNRGNLNLIHGVFKVDQEMQSLERIWMYLEYAHSDFDFIIDNTSVKKIAGICGSDLVRNGNFEEFGKFNHFKLFCAGNSPIC